MATYKYPRAATTVDIIIFTIREQALHVLLVNRGIDPFKGSLALPGGFVQVNETLIAAAQRELQEETQLANFHLKMFGVFDDVNRDPRDRVISIGFYAIVPSHDLIVLAGSDAEHADWYPFESLPSLAFDHKDIIDLAFSNLTSDLYNTCLAAKFLDEEFTLAEFQAVYETILTKKVDKRNFRKWISSTDYFIKTDNKKSGAQHRPAALYKIKDALKPSEKIAQIQVNNSEHENKSKSETESNNNTNNDYNKGYEQGFKKALSKITNFIKQQD
ncbi:MAG: NUDIX hydrolase [Colwellia sp.]|nr:NUDIX hydrolase [Colwellia sp.]